MSTMKKVEKYIVNLTFTICEVHGMQWKIYWM